MSDELLNWDELCERLHKSSYTCAKWLKDGIIPKPIEINRESRYWRWSTVLDHLSHLHNHGKPQLYLEVI